MGFLDSLKAWLKTEAAEAKDLGQATKTKLEADLDRREANLDLTPEQRLDQLQGQIADGDSSFEALQDKIEGRGAHADATSEVAEQARAAADDVLDLESEEVIPPEPPPA